jgi:GAF domain-containing protein
MVGVAMDLLRETLAAGPPRAAEPAGQGEDEALLSRFLSCKDIEQLLREAVQELRARSGVPYNQILLLVPGANIDGVLLVVADSIPANRQAYRVASLQGLIGLAVLRGMTVRAEDVRDHARYIKASPQTKSELVVPIKRRTGTMLGVVNCESEERGYFTREGNPEPAVEELARTLGRALDSRTWLPEMSMTTLPWVRLAADRA